MKYAVIYKSIVTATYESISIVARDESESWDEIQKKISHFKWSLIKPLENTGMIHFREELQIKLVLIHGPSFDLLLLNQEEGLMVARSLEKTQRPEILQSALKYLGLDLEEEIATYEDDLWERQEEQRRQNERDYDSIPY